MNTTHKTSISAAPADASDPRHTIELHRANGSWIARHSDPEIIAAFDGCGTIATAFTDKADPREVLATIQKRNPRYRVLIAPGELVGEREARDNGSRFTPGPWVLQLNAPHQTLVRGGSPQLTVCEIFPQLADERHEANARLVAAAPELLARMIGLLEYVDQFGLHANDNRVTWARNAVAKAGGSK